MNRNRRKVDRYTPPSAKTKEITLKKTNSGDPVPPESSSSPSAPMATGKEFTPDTLGLAAAAGSGSEPQSPVKKKSKTASSKSDKKGGCNKKKTGSGGTDSKARKKKKSSKKGSGAANKESTSATKSGVVQKLTFGADLVDDSKSGGDGHQPPTTEAGDSEESDVIEPLDIEVASGPEHEITSVSPRSDSESEEGCIVGRNIPDYKSYGERRAIRREPQIRREPHHWHAQAMPSSRTAVTNPFNTVVQQIEGVQQVVGSIEEFRRLVTPPSQIQAAREPDNAAVNLDLLATINDQRTQMAKQSKKLEELRAQLTDPQRERRARLTNPQRDEGEEVPRITAQLETMERKQKKMMREQRKTEKRMKKKWNKMKNFAPTGQHTPSPYYHHAYYHGLQPQAPPHLPPPHYYPGHLYQAPPPAHPAAVPYPPPTVAPYYNPVQFAPPAPTYSSQVYGQHMQAFGAMNAPQPPPQMQQPQSKPDPEWVHAATLTGILSNLPPVQQRF